MLDKMQLYKLIYFSN